VTHLLFDPFVDQRALVDATMRLGVANGLVLIVSQWDADNVGPSENRFRYFLEFVLEIGHIVALSEGRQLLDGVGRR
jgi:hypothetical protein